MILFSFAQMKTSRVVAKVVSRLFLLLLLLAVIPLLQADSNKLQHIYLTGNKWTLVFPGLLFAGFIGLFIYCTIKKYSNPDLNWLLIINTVVLMAYCATLYLRIYELVG